MRDRLIELIRKSGCVDTWNYRTDDFKEPNPIYEFADYLLANGVIVPPCKIGQICYKVCGGKILEVRVVSISYEPLPAFSYTIRFNSLGVLCLMQDGTRNEKYSWDIFLTREEAEQALKGGAQE